jgi:hypothetical protein
MPCTRRIGTLKLTIAPSMLPIESIGAPAIAQSCAGFAHAPDLRRQTLPLVEYLDPSLGMYRLLAPGKGFGALHYNGASADGGEEYPRGCRWHRYS